MMTLRNEGDRIILLYLQGQLFFGSARKLVAAIGAAAAGDRVEYCILSFARVPEVDPSAARHLKTAVDRVRHRGCKILCCRTNQQVFSALCAAGVVTAPDPDLLKHLQGLRWKTVPMSSSSRQGSQQRLERRRRWLLASPKTIACPASPSSASPRVARSSSDTDDLDPDAFSHETDALDYCDGRVVDRFCYGAQRVHLKPYMLAYRDAARPPGARLEEWAFEDMNGLPRGFMGRLRGYCEVNTDLSHWTKLQVDGALCFVMQGAVSLVQMLPKAEETDSLQTEIQPFSFRQGKRLHKRYLPGNVVGKSTFVLTGDHKIDTELEPKAVVSSQLGRSAEVWILRPAAWAEMPSDLKGPMVEMLCLQLAETARHSRLQER